jgi:methionyl-tRNA formyltransferase
MKTVFLGTPQFAVPCLEALVSAGHEVAAVITQPDRPKGRGQELACSPVKECALRLSLPVFQPLKVRLPEVVEQLRGIRPEVMVVVGYGQIIPQSIIDIPPFGIVNVHASLLPKYRGAAPIQWAIANGETVTGVTTMQIDAGLDTGAMLLKTETLIGPSENALEVGARLAGLGAALLIETLARLEAGVLAAQPQDDADATWAPILEREHGLVDWSQSGAVIANRARGFLPWPGAWTWFRGKRLNLWQVRIAGVESPAIPGRLFSSGRRLFAACGAGEAIEILELQQEGRKRLPAAAFLNGTPLEPDDTLGAPPE